MTIRKLFALTFNVATAFVVLAIGTAQAQSYPAKPIRWIVPIAAGGANDVAARLLSAHLAPGLGQQLIIENRPGAAGIIGMDLVAKSPADGYTVISVDNSFVLNNALYQKVPYDPERDFEPIGLYGRIPMLIVVRASLPVQNITELIALAKADPGKLTFGSAGKGSPHHLLQELFKQRTGTDFTHVPFKGGTPAVAEIAAGRLDITVSNWGSVAGHVSAGRLRVLAVSTAQRSPRQDHIPTIKEAGGPEIDVAAWQGVLAPKGTPRAIVERLHAELIAVLKNQKVVDTMGDSGMVATPSSPADFAAFIKSERALWEPLIKSWKISLD
jgi:tripartite-type tricarboxylate transporter receptor subunit TctC